MDCYGPLDIQPTQRGLFWYGVHSAEMLFRTLGTGCVKVSAITSGDHDLITGPDLEHCCTRTRKHNLSTNPAIRNRIMPA